MMIDNTDQGDAAVSGGEASLEADPFATDLFGAGAAVAVSRQPQQQGTGASKTTISLPWQRRLNRVTLEQAHLSSGLSALPAALSPQMVARVLARYTQTAQDEVSITLVSLREADLSRAGSNRATASYLFAHLIAEPGGSPMAVEMDTGFAAGVIDRVLGGDGMLPETLRELSITERAVIEFLHLMLIRELNQDLGEPLIKLEAIATNAPAWLVRQDGDLFSSRGLIATFRLRIAATVGLARIYLTRDALSSLRYLARKQSSSYIAETIKQYSGIAPEVRFSLIIGKTEITVGDLSTLECGDVVIVEQPSVKWLDGEIRGRVHARIGDGQDTIIIGRTAQPEIKEDASGRAKASAINLVVERISGGGSMRLADGFNMEEKIEVEEAPGEGAAVLDGLLLTVHVELAARRIRLDELAGLRAGQIIELGCQATDPVDLVVDGRRIARGELVDIEGRLGVQLTEVPSQI